MKAKYLGFLLSILFIGINICSGQLFGTRYLRNLSPIPIKKSSCPATGKMVYFPKYGDMREFKTCYQEVAKARNLSITSIPLKRTREAILDQGFFLITYNNVTTKDGYILKVFRITGSPSQPPRKKKPAVMLLHPMLSSSDSWFTYPGNKNKTLVNKLVNAGYEVWLPNSRGTVYSPHHVSLNPNWDLKYWDFSSHEEAMYEFPLFLELMLNETGNEKIFFVGDSQSTSVYAAALAEMPELNDKIEASFWMGSTLFLGHSSNLVRLLTYLLDIGPWSQELANVFLGGRVIFGNAIINPLLYRFCSATAMTCGLCGNAYFFIYGFDPAQVKYADIVSASSITMSPISFKNALHIGQNLRNCRFQQYDYGPRKNYRIYGQAYPPLYNISNVRAPVYMWYGDEDNMAPPVDQKLTRDALPPGTVKGFFRVNWKYFNHLDFLMAKDVDILVYNDMLKIMESYTKKSVENTSNLNSQVN